MFRSAWVSVLLAAAVTVTCLFIGPANGAVISGRVVNGTSARIQDIPYQVAILFYYNQACGASILSETTLLTAARCFDQLYLGEAELGDWVGRVGSTFWAYGGQIVYFASLTPHEGYDIERHDNDIALLTLTEPLVYSDRIQPVPLPPADTHLTGGDIMQVSGWGRLSHDGNFARVLQRINIAVWSRVRCIDLFEGVHEITASMVCAGNTESLGDSCNGDYGGPMVDMAGVLYGIVSWSLDCNYYGFTGVYTYIPVMLDWINENRIK